MNKVMMKIRKYDGYKIAEFVQKDRRITLYMDPAWCLNTNYDSVAFDGNNYIRVRTDNRGIAYVDVTTTMYDWDNRVSTGYKISFVTDECDFNMVMVNGGNLLCGDEEPMAKIVLSESAQEQIAKMGEREKNALRKFMRDHFQWRRSNTIRIYADFGQDFFFQEDNGICGGIILSTYGKRSGYPETRYEMHT